MITSKSKSASGSCGGSGKSRLSLGCMTGTGASSIQEELPLLISLAAAGLGFYYLQIYPTLALIVVGYYAAAIAIAPFLVKLLPEKDRKLSTGDAEKYCLAIPIILHLLVFNLVPWLSAHSQERSIFQYIFGGHGTSGYTLPMLIHHMGPHFFLLLSNVAGIKLFRKIHADNTVGFFVSLIGTLVRAYFLLLSGCFLYSFASLYFFATKSLLSYSTVPHLIVISFFLYGCYMTCLRLYYYYCSLCKCCKGE